MERHSLRRRYGRKMFFKGALFASTALVLPALAPRLALAQIAPNTTPTGGQVVGGSATIGQAPGTTTVSQASQLAAINWQSFNVGSAAKVQFNQPDASAIALNRVVGGNLSQINGQINANGQIVLINQSGVVFGRGSQVNAESVVVSTSDIATSDFMAGKMNFSGAPKPGAQIVNNGNITARDAGLVGLVAPQVLNNGVITAQLGQVVLAGGSAFTLDLYGDRLISLDVTQAVRAVDVGGRLVPALVTNSGLILADGGKVTLTAQDADALVTQLIAAGGTIQANTVGAQTGTIAISGVGGNISIAGNLIAAGTGAGQKGGDIQAMATGTVAVAATAQIVASGNGGGGVIALGTDISRAEAGPTDSAAPAAAAVSIAQGATIRADATGIGNGGTVTLLSQDFTNFAGNISVLGGPQGGGGGLAEISSHGVISLSGTVADVAIDGQPGEILLDPATLIVTVVGGQQNTTASEVDSTWLGSLNGNIVLSASSLLEVLSDVKSKTLDSLSLVSGGDVSIDALISLGGSLEVDAAGAIQIGPSYSTAGPVTLISDTGGLDANDIYLNGSAGIDIGAKIDILAAGGTLALDSTNGAITNTTLVAGLVSVSGVIDTPTLSGGTASIGGDVFLANSLNAIADFDNFNLGAGGTLVLEDAAGLAIANVVAPTATFISTDTTDAEDFNVTGLLDAKTLLVFDNSKLAAEGSNGTVITGDLALFGGGAVSLTSDFNSISVLQASLNSPSDLYLDDDRILTINSAVDLGTVFSFTGAGINETGGGLINVPTFTAFNVAGDINLEGANSFASFLADTAGTVSVYDTAALDIPGLVSGSSVFITLAAGKALTIGADPGEIDATGAGGTLAIIADSLLLPDAFKGQIQAAQGTIIVAPATGNEGLTLTDLAVSGGGVLGSDFLTDIKSQALALQLGTAGSTGAIALGTSGTDDIDLGAVNLSLVTAGGVTQTGPLVAGTLAFTTGNFEQGNGALTLTEFTGTAASGSVSLASNPLTRIGTFGPVTAKGTIDLADFESAEIIGAISTSGTIILDGAGFTETGAGALDAATLTTGAGGIDGSAVLAGPNDIGTIAAFEVVGGTNGISFNNTAALAIDGEISAPGEITLSDSTAGIAEITGGFILAASLATSGTIGGALSLGSAQNLIAAFGPITASGNITLNDDEAANIAGLITTTGVITLDNAGGGYTETTGGALSAATLTTGALSIGGETDLTNANTIGTLAAFDLTTGNFTLNNSQALIIDGGVTVPGQFTILDATAGVTEASGGVITAGSLATAGQKLGGNVLLGSSLNQIGSLDLAATGTVNITDGEGVSIFGGLTGSNVYLTLAAAGAALSFADAATGITTATGGTLAIVADVIDAPSGDTTAFNAPGGTIFVAPFTSADGITVSSEAASTTRLVLGANFIADSGSASQLVIGDATMSGGIQLGEGPMDVEDFGARNLILLTTGNITQNGVLTAGTIAFNAENFSQAGTGTINAAYVSGTATGQEISLLGTNAIGTLGALTAPDDIKVTDSLAAGLVLDGLLSVNTATGIITLQNLAGGVSEDGTGLLSAGTLTTGVGTIEGDADFGNGNTIADLGNFTASGNILLQDTGTLSINGAVFTPESLTLEDFSGGIFQSTGGITAATLSSGGEIDGKVSLAGVNAIATISNFQLASGFGLQLADTGSLTAAGTVSAQSIVLSDGTGTIFLTGGLSAPGEVDLAAAGGVYQTAGSLTAGSFDGAVSGTGDISLTSTTNSISSIGNVSLKNGSFLLTDLHDVQIIGTVTTPDSLILSVSSIGETGAGAIAAGTLDNQLALSGISLGGQNHIASLAGDFVLAGSGDFFLNDLTFLTLTSEISAGGGVTFGGAGVTQAPSGFIDTPTLSGAGSITGDMLLTSGNNNIGALQNLTLAGTLDVADTGNLSLDGIGAAAATFSNNNFSDFLNFTGPVSVAGALELDYTFGNYAGAGAVTAATLDTAGDTANNLDLTGANSIATLAAFTSDNDFDLNDLVNLTIAGALSAPTIALASPEIFLDAAVTAGGFGQPGTIAVITDGITAAAGIQFNAQTGTIEIEPLTDSVIDLGGNTAGELDLPGSIFGAADEIVIGNLPLGNPLGAGSQANSIVVDAGSFGPGLVVLSAADGIFDNGVLTADTIAFDGGGFVQTKPAAQIIANTIYADAAITGLVSLTSQGNQIGALGSIDSSAEIDITDAIPLTVDGPITASDIALADSGGIDIAGTISAATGGTIALRSASITPETGGTITADVVQISPFVAGDPIDLGGTSFGGLEISQALLNIIGAGILRIGIPGGSTIFVENQVSVSAPELVLTSGSIDIFGTITGGTLLSLASAGGISESVTGNIDFATLTGFGGDVALTGANSFATLAAFSASSDLALNDDQAMTIAGLVTAAGTLSLEDAASILETTGTLIAATLDSGGTAIGGDVFLTNSNTLGAIGDLTLAAGTLQLIDSGLLDIAGTLSAPVASLSAGNIEIAGALDGTYLLLATPGTIAETTGTIAAATLAGGVIGGAVSLLQANQIGTIQNLSAGGPIGIDDGEILTIAGLISTASTIILEGAGATELSSGTLAAAALTSDDTVIDGNVFLTNANPIGTITNFALAGGDTLALDVTGPLALTGSVTAPNAYLTASSIIFAGLETFANTLALESPGEILQSSGTITAGTLTSIGSIGGDTELLDLNSIAALGAFTLASGATLALDDSGPLTVSGTVNADFATLSAGTIALAGSIIGTALALESTGDIFETTGALSEATLTSGGTTIGGILSLGNGNAVNTLGALAALGGITLNNFQSLDIAGQITTPGALILQARGGVTEITGGAVTAGTFGTGTGTISGALALLNANSISNLGNLIADGGIALNDLTPLDIAGLVTTAGAILLEGQGGITESGTLDAATLTTGGNTYAGNVLLDGSNAIPDLDSFTLAAGDRLDFADTGLLAVTGTVFATTATITAGSFNIEGELAANFLALGAKGSLAESTGFISAATLAGDGTIGGAVVLGNKNNKIGTLGAFAADSGILINDGEALSIAGLVATPDTLTLEDSTGGITERGGGAIAAATLNSGFTQIGGDVLLLNANTIGALGAFTVTAGDSFALIDTGLLTVAGTVFAPDITLASPTIAIAGALDATSLALESTGNIFETSGTISTATLTSGGTDIGGFLSLANANSIAALGGITATGDIFINDGAAETIAGLVTTGQTITLEGAGPITETTGSLDALELTSANTTIGGNVILTNQNSIATLANMLLVSGATLSLTDTQTLTLAGTVTASDTTFSVPGLILDGVLNAGQLFALAGGSFTEGPDGGIVAGTVTSLGTVDGDVLLVGANNTIGNVQNFTVGSADTFDLADHGLLNVSGSLTGGFVTLSAGSLSITSVLTAPTLVVDALTGVTETGGTLIDDVLSTGGAAIGGDISLPGANTIGTIGNIALTGNFLLANTGTLIIAGSLATPTGDVSLEDNAGITETTGLIDAATLDSGGTTLGGDVFAANANTIGTLGAITLAAGTFDLADATALTLAGGLTAPDITLSSAGALTEIAGGVIAAGTLALPSIGGGATLLQPNAIATLVAVSAAGNISLDDLSPLDIAGLVVTSGILTLEDFGSVTELPGGILAAATLTTGAGSIAGAASLTNQNQIGTIGVFAAGGDISFTDSQTYDIAGLVTTPDALNLSGQGFSETAGGGVDAATLLTTGSIQGNAVLSQTNTILTLAAFGVTGDLLLNDTGALAITGAVSAGGTVGLAASGDVVESGAGAISAALLTTDGGDIAGKAILNGANRVTSLGAFTATSALLLTNTGPLTLSGAINAGATLGLAVAGNLTELAGAIVTATSFTTDGGQITGSASLDQSGNRIGTIGNVTVGGGLVLADSDALDFGGDVRTGAPGLTVTDASANITQTGGTITTPLLNADGLNIVLGGPNDITALGQILAANNATVNSDAAAGLTLSGTMSAGSVLSLSSDFGLTEASAATLLAGNIDLQTGRQATLAGVNLASNNFSFYGRAALTQAGGTIAAGGTAVINAYYGFTQNAGRLEGQDIFIQTTTGVTLAGVVSAASSLSVGTAETLVDSAQYLKAMNADFGGNEIELGGVNLVTGQLFASGGQIVQPNTGVISAGTLDLIAAGVTGGSMPIYGVSLTGAIDAGSASITTRGDGAGIFLSGYLSAASLLALSAGNNIQQAGGTIIAGGAPAQLNAGTSIVLGGVDDFSAGLAAGAGTTFAQTGILNAAYASVFASDILLTGHIAVTNDISLTGFTQIDDEAAALIARDALFSAPVITLNGVNAFSTGLTATAGGGIIQNNTAAAIFAPGATLTAADITLDGTDSFSGALDLIAAGNIFHTSAETLTAGTLIGSAAQTAAFTGATDFGTIGSFIMQDSTFVLDNDNSLTIIGPLAANQVSINAIGEITLDGSPQGGLFISGVNEGKTITSPTAIDSVLEVTPAPGSDIATILQTGTFFINSGPEAALIDNGYFNNAAATLFMLANTIAGDSLDITFAPAPPDSDGLYGPSITLPIALGPLGVGTGNAILYEIIVFSGASTQFTGTLGGLAGPASAGKGFVVPFPKPPLQFNACPIGSVNCVILPTEALPAGNPLQNFDVTQRKRRHLAKSVVLPGVATRDF